MRAAGMRPTPRPAGPTTAPPRGPLEAVGDQWTLAFHTNGRASRSAWWWATVLHTLLIILTIPSGGPALLLLLLFLPGWTSLTIRRMNDRMIPRRWILLPALLTIPGMLAFPAAWWWSGMQLASGHVTTGPAWTLLTGMILLAAGLTTIIVWACLPGRTHRP